MPPGVNTGRVSVWDSFGNGYLNYGADRNGGFNFQMFTTTSGAQQFRVVLSSDDQSRTYCVGTYIR